MNDYNGIIDNFISSARGNDIVSNIAGKEYIIANEASVSVPSSNSYVSLSSLNIPKGNWILVSDCYASTSFIGNRWCSFDGVTFYTKGHMIDSYAARNSNYQAFAYLNCTQDTTVTLRVGQNSGSTQTLMGKFIAIKLSDN
ncbi:hypothetical protein D3C72_1674450 [compost metagenome]